jgi:hypothetical protein
MKSILLFALFSFVVSIVSIGIGFTAGVSGAAGSNVSQLYAGSIEFKAIHDLIYKEEYGRAKEVICSSLKSRFNILEMARPLISQMRKQEIDRVFEQMEASSFENESSSLVDNCV